MSNSLTETITKTLRELTRIDYIKPGEFPNIDLYMDQVTTFMNTHMSASKLKADDTILTKTMINNYAKNNILPPPEKKKYSKEHMIVLIFIYYFKSILSISEIQDMLGPLTDKFFNPKNNKDGISMEDVYDNVYSSIKSQLSTVSFDIMKKSEAADKFFSEVSNKKDREFLQNFSIICMLSFDVFLKKQLIQSLIDAQKPASKSTSSKSAAAKKPTAQKKPAAQKRNPASKKPSNQK